MSGARTDGERRTPSAVARWIHRCAVPIVVAWLAVIAALTIGVPPLERVEQEHAVSLTPEDAPAVKAMKRMGNNFKESTSDSVALIVIEGEQPLDAVAHQYYERLLGKLRNDSRHVQHIQDFWSDPLTAGAAQSADGKAAYVQLNLAGNVGQALANESAEAVRGIVERTPPPPRVRAYVTGPAALTADMYRSGDRTVAAITAVAVATIFVMLLLVYRSLATVILLLLMVGLELLVARGVVAFLGSHGLVGLTTYAVNLLVSLGIAAGTDYGIFFIGRYQEARQAGEDRETAFYTTYRGVAHVVLASGLTIAGAVFCLSFTRLPVFRPLGAPCAVGMLAAIAVALTLVPAVIVVGGRFGLFDPRRALSNRRWRRLGTAVVRWPAPILAATCAGALIGLLALPGFKINLNDRDSIPADFPANQGYQAAARHFPESRMEPEILLIEADQDMRNPADFLVLNKVAKAIFAIPGIARVQAITRPEGTPIEHTSLPFLMSMQNAGQVQNMQLQRARMEGLRKQADNIDATIATMTTMYDVMRQLQTTTHSIVGKTTDLAGVTDRLRDNIADFDDFWRPIRSYFYWEKHCYDIPICWSFRSLFDAMDGVDQVDEKFHSLVDDLGKIDVLLPQLLAQFPILIETMTSMRDTMQAMYSTMSGFFSQIDAAGSDATAMGKAFDAARNDESFYLPPDVFANKDFQRAESMFLSPDGTAVRFVISHRGDPLTPEGLAHVAAIRTAAQEALKGTPLEYSRIHITGAAATVKDLWDRSQYDLLTAAVSAICLIFAIMLVVTRSLIAALTIVGTVTLSLGASLGLSVLVWQYLLGIQLHWEVLAMAIIVLLAVGSDYNLLLVSRLKEEIGAGIKTGMIRAMGGTGKVVTSAGLVFACTMGSMVVSDLRIIGQAGTTIGLGLLFDTLVVRAFMTPSLAALLGRWFWWPLNVRPRPASSMLRPYGPRPLVRSLVLTPATPGNGHQAEPHNGRRKIMQPSG
ncbi:MULTISPECIES: RND family transporter [unclassified Mycobacterium]|uniref:MMPL/RND family transporter n=1 Tax=unclassified Mycobacterium TaxID=2642494 RepID=UPI0009EEED1C|nr:MULTISPECIES: RND family transporter [unclassified Mycobacterium]